MHENTWLRAIVLRVIQDDFMRRHVHIDVILLQQIRTQAAIRLFLRPAAKNVSGKEIPRLAV